MNTSIWITDISDMIDLINEASSIDEILEIINKIDVFEVALEAAEAFSNESIMYAERGENAIIRALELGGASDGLDDIREQASEAAGGDMFNNNLKLEILCFDLF